MLNHVFQNKVKEENLEHQYLKNIKFEDQV